MNYEIVLDEQALDSFIAYLPQEAEDEVYYFCLFGRHKYCKEAPQESNLSRFVARKCEIKEKILRLQSPVGSFCRNGNAIPQEALALYMGLNPRSLPKANKGMLMELAKRFARGDLNFNPISVATTEIHRAVGRKFFVDFDFDTEADISGYTPTISDLLPANSYRVMKTRGGFHLILELDKMSKLGNWYKMIADLPGCDVRGSNTLTPVPGCTQGGFSPYFL